MKIKFFILTLASTIALLSCVKNPNQKTQNDELSDFINMKVPANFDWKMSNNITCNFTSLSHPSEISLFLKGAESPFATFVVDNATTPITIPIAETETSIVAKYLKADGLSAPVTLNITDNCVKFAIPSDSKPIIETKSNQGSQYINYPTNGEYGTYMFEDLWPSNGDYDLNDFVINYKISVLGAPGKKKVHTIIVDLRIAATGGSKPFNIYLQLNKVKSTDISGAELNEKGKNSAETPELAFLSEGTSEPALVSIKGIRRNLKGISNNRKEDNLALNDMVTVSAMLYSRDFNGLNLDDLNEEDFNIFIAQEENDKLHEVHVGGYAPSYLGIDLYNEFKKTNSNINQSQDYYYSNNKLVWAIKVPKELPHAIESADFTEAYPNFKAWVESGGATHNDWYNQPNADKTISSK